jgi:putative FmdB family regulatory protein
MPTYEYVCEKCHQQFDIFQSIRDDPLTTCPKERCSRQPWGKGKVRRLIGAGAGLIFKGSGFYITDYRSKEYKDAAKKETAAPAAKASDTKAPTTSKSESSAGKSETGSKKP